MITNGEGGTHTVVDSTAVWSLPTGGRADVLRHVTIPAAARGMQVLTASVRYDDSGGNPVVQTARDTFFVQSPGQLSVQLRPNPVHGDPAQSKVAVELSAQGGVQVDVYDRRPSRDHARTCTGTLQVRGALISAASGANADL